MPVHETDGGYKWGSHGKTYPNKAGAERQAAAAYASGYEGKAILTLCDQVLAKFGPFGRKKQPAAPQPAPAMPLNPGNPRGPDRGSPKPTASWGQKPGPWQKAMKSLDDIIGY